MNAAPLAAQKPAEVAEQRRIETDRLLNDWAGLGRYRQANAELARMPRENRVVFMGNSITEAWASRFATLFPGKPYIGRGIGGQTTPQMLVRFRQDVIELEPKVVVILAGTNDLAGNTGPATLDMIQDNLVSMVELAKANGIRVILSSVLPVYDYPWRPGLAPAAQIVALNTWMREYAAKNDVGYVDYHTAMADERQGLKRALSEDGVHPNDAGYRVMAPLVERGIAEALARGRTEVAPPHEAGNGRGPSAPSSSFANAQKVTFCAAGRDASVRSPHRKPLHETAGDRPPPVRSLRRSPTMASVQQLLVVASLTVVGITAAPAQHHASARPTSRDAPIPSRFPVRRTR